MKNILILTFLSTQLTLFAQIKSQKVNDHLLKGNLLFTPSITYELGISKKSTLKGEIGTSITIFDNFGETRVGVFSKLEGQYKFYYNLSKRAEEGKNTINNSANFIALTSIYSGENDFFSDAERLSELLLVGPVWGIQRSYKNGFNFLFEIGFGYDFAYQDSTTDNGRPFPIIGFELGWIIFGK